MIQCKNPHRYYRTIISLLLVLAVMLVPSVPPIAFVSAAGTSRVVFHVNNPELENKDVVYKIITPDRLNSDGSLSHFYDIPGFAKDEYVFQGWYHNADYSQSCDTADVPVDFDSNTAGKDKFPTRGSDYHIYAKWIKVDTVDKAADDENNVSSYSGFGIAGVQIREENLYDSNVRDSGNETPYDDAAAEVPGGLRFVASVSESLLSNVVGISKIPAASSEATAFGAKYGYVVGTANRIREFIDHYEVYDTDTYKLEFNGSNVNGADTTKAGKNDYRYITNVDCTSKVKATAASGIVTQDHKNYNDYRLYTLVVTYEGDSSSKKDEKIDARAYLQYYDANGKLRVFYNDYDNAEGVSFYGGCMCSYNQVLNSQPNSNNTTWHQCPQKVRDYLAYLEEHPYPDGVYDTSVVTEYAKLDYVTQLSKPLPVRVDGKVYTDLVPNVSVPYLTSSSSGTVTFVDKLRWINTTYEGLIPSLPKEDYIHHSYPYGINTRDIGGWSCADGVDGKPCTVKYGLIYRGGEPNPVDKELMVDKLGIRTELQLLPKDEQRDRAGISVWGVDWVGNDQKAYSVYGIETGGGVRWANDHLWNLYLTTVFDSVAAGKPIYIHCGVGADRTGAMFIMLESILGMSENEIAQDYELTSFAGHQRLRTNEGFYKLINDIKAWPLADGLTEDTLENHALSFALSKGCTREQINAFRNAMIDGNPAQI